MSDADSEELKRPGTTARLIYDRLVQSILQGEFVGGQPIREARLAREWNVSRTPLREAVRRAAEAGFLVLRPNQAPVVRELCEADIDQLYDLRLLLETHALRRAWSSMDAKVLQNVEKLATAAKPGKGKDWRERCLKFDRALHRLWTRRSGNKWLEADIQRQHRFWLVFQTWVGQDESVLRKAHAEHITILEAIRSRNRSTAVAALRKHILTSAAAVKKVLAAKNREG